MFCPAAMPAVEFAVAVLPAGFALVAILQRAAQLATYRAIVEYLNPRGVLFQRIARGPRCTQPRIEV
jgi:hypothetical protein